MKTYLVGGAVRDTLLGLAVRERDWLVTGSDPQQLLRLGYRQVGRHFPVFLHPDTHEEYALPRAAPGNEGDTPATLEQDLARRDLTINAMAMDVDGQLIDPLGGEQDLRDRLLRHTPAFRDDPLRVLRLARFAARYRSLGFRLAAETLALARRMVRAGDLDGLVPERVFAEIAKAFAQDDPVAFIQTLRRMRALAVVLPEVDRLFGVPQPVRFHPEVDTGKHTLMVLQQACRLSRQAPTRFASLLHDVGKGATPKQDWPRHIAHEQRGVPLIQALARRLCLPNAWRDLAVLACRYHLHCHRALELKPKTLLKTLNALDAFRQPQRFEQFLLVCEADMRGRKGLQQQPYPQKVFLAGALHAAKAVDLQVLSGSADGGGGIAARIARLRISAIAGYRQAFEATPVPEEPPPGEGASRA